MAETIAINKLTSIFYDLAGRLKTGWRPLWNVLTFSPADDAISFKSGVCISIEEGFLSAAYGSRFLSKVWAKGFKRLQTQDIYAQPAEFASFMEMAATDFNCQGADITLSIPKAWTIIRTIELPASVKDNISDVINYELDRFTPLSPDSAFYDFRIVSEDTAKINVLLAAARADIINPYLAALSEKGFALKRLTSNIFATAALQSFSGGENESLIKKLDAFAARSPESEASGSISYNAYGGVIESLWPKAKGLNLLSKGRHTAPKRPMALTAILLAAIAALGVYYIISPLQIEETRLKALDLQLASMKDDVKKAEALKKEIEALEPELAAIRNFKEGRTPAIEIMREMTAILPKNAWLTRLRITNKNIEIEGYAASPSELLPKLEATKHFRKVEFSSPSFFDARLNASKFMIRMEREDAAKTEGTKDHNGK